MIGSGRKGLVRDSSFLLFRSEIKEAENNVKGRGWLKEGRERKRTKMFVTFFEVTLRLTDNPLIYSSSSSFFSLFFFPKPGEEERKRVGENKNVTTKITRQRVWKSCQRQRQQASRTISRKKGVTKTSTIYLREGWQLGRNIFLKGRTDASILKRVTDWLMCCPKWMVRLSKKKERLQNESSQTWLAWSPYFPTN